MHARGVSGPLRHTKHLIGVMAGRITKPTITHIVIRVLFLNEKFIQIHFTKFNLRCVKLFHSFVNKGIWNCCECDS